ncbi:M15 family metallopeptidase [Thermoflexibacter ruber]|uniref:D-alanyl-D-alanine dipeptidase n=1 Tax=Thermoflexibacter ruber TaxID=1003 RepID=A0A1I2IQZ5_9BACT|nr:M15 family metallopeptidase [Thermoflexibacter ruber]SFF44832.1 D-alanyl-D-alanine dipeptidase [Thermoflexibacter ruber]
MKPINFIFVLLPITIFISIQALFPITENASPHLSYTKEDSLYYETLHDTAMVELIRYDSDFMLDIKYATKDNFTKQVLYDCPRAFLRKKVAKDLLNAHKEFKKLGYRIKIFDGYRPHSVQFKMWDLTPDKRYVGNPYKGSMHNRGCAVDLTLVDNNGKELDMGTPYDFFGEEAHITYNKLPEQVLSNRRVLKQVLEKNGFRALSTEWWHFSYNRNVYNILNIPIPCQQEVREIK